MDSNLVAIALTLIAQGQSNGDGWAEAYERGARWARDGVSARCLIEVSSPDDRRLLTTEKGREAVTIKAQIIAGLSEKQVDVIDQLSKIIEEESVKQKDLFDNYLITEDEFHEKTTIYRQNVDESVVSIVETMTTFPSCNFFRLRSQSPTVRRAAGIYGRD